MGILTTLWLSTIGLLILTICLFTFSFDHGSGVVEDESTNRFYHHICYDGYKYLVFNAPQKFGLAQVLEEGPFGVRPVRCKNDVGSEYGSFI